MNYKKIFEKCYGKKISDRSFYRIKALMNSLNLPVSKSNLEIVAKIKSSIFRHKIPLKIALGYYLKISNIQGNLSGNQLYAFIQKMTEYKAHRTTIKRWFEGDFNPEKIYNSVEISNILLKSFIYILRNNHANIIISDRSSSLSIKEIGVDIF